MGDDISSRTTYKPDNWFSDPRFDSHECEITRREPLVFTDQTIVKGYGRTARDAEADAHFKYGLHKERESYLTLERAENRRLASLGSGRHSGSYCSSTGSHVGDWMLRIILILGLIGAAKCTTWCMRTEIEATFGPDSHHLDNPLYKW